MKSTGILVLLLGWTLFAASSVESADADIEGSNISSAEQSFLYVASTLQKFNNTGRLVNNPGIDGSDLEHFIQLLEDHYQIFSSDFNSNSAMCSFYRDPENSRMTIEDRAEISFSLLSALDDRIGRYIEINEDFENEMEKEFGSIVLEAVNEVKTSAEFNHRLPSSNFDEAAVINFLDAACI